MQRRILKAYAFRTQYPTPLATYTAWHEGDSFCLTVLPHPTEPLLISKRDIDDEAKGFTHIALTDPVMGHRVLTNLELWRNDGEEQSPAEAALRAGERTDPQGETSGRAGIRVSSAGEAVHEDGEFKQASLTILAAMMASPEHADTPVSVLVDKSVAAAATLLHKIYEGA